MLRPSIFLSIFLMLGHVGCHGQSTKSSSTATHVPVELKKVENGWQLFRDGQPYYIKGAGGDGPLKQLSELGANSVRTWGVGPHTKTLLDQAHANGLTVTVGIWLEHVGKGFDYEDAEACQRQEKAVMSVVEKYKSHPAVLAWGIGNEVENGYADQASIYKHIESIAAKVKKIDPHHPTMSVIAEIGQEKVESTNKYCPSIDIIGINSYAGASSLVDRYRKLNPVKPFIVTEFGPFGTWESPKNENGVVIEKTSTQKAATYANSYNAFLKDPKACLGSYVFLWGHKQESTPTWFGMLTPDGCRTASVDALSKAWTGTPVGNTCPVIEQIKISKTELKPGEEFKAAIKTSDAETDPIATDWAIIQEGEEAISGGDFQSVPPAFPKLVVSSDDKGAQLAAPMYAGLYRVYAVARDGNKGAATANVPFRVLPGDLQKSGSKVEIPHALSTSANEQLKIETGENFTLDAECKEKPKSGKSCLKVVYNGSGKGAFISWLSKAEQGIDLDGATKVTFSIRGQRGGERIKVQVGSRNKTRPDTAFREMGFALGGGWIKLEMDISRLDLRGVKTIFSCELIDAEKPMTFYLDDIRFE